MKRVIRLGDPTSHGGTVVSASSTVIINGKPVARVGDSVTCPIPGHGVVTIVEGDSAWLDNGCPIALEGHKTSCGASLISTLGTLFRSPNGSGESSSGLSTAKAIASSVLPAAAAMPAAAVMRSVATASQDDDELEYYFVAERDDGSPLNLAYRIDKASEKLHEGALDSDGRTVALPVSKEGEAVFWIQAA